jgi:hypothetical protein
MIIVLIAPNPKIKERVLDTCPTIVINLVLISTAGLYVDRSPTPLNVYTGQNPRQHVVLIAIQTNANNNYLSETAGIILTFLG